MHTALTILQKEIEETLQLRIAAAILTCERSRLDVFVTCHGWDGSSRQWSSTQRDFRAIPFQFTVPIDGACGPQPHPGIF